MQTIPASNAHTFFQARRSSFKLSQQSPLNPLTRRSDSFSSSASLVSTESARQHLANLEKLLRNGTAPDPIVNPVGRGQPQDGKRRALIDRLNLARIWPEVKAAAEEVSPKHLKRLQRLLSRSVEYSPRNELGPRWEEYHGSRDWGGLLDPLDENLRREVVRYGELIQSAYHAFHSDPSSTAKQVSLPDPSYRMTKNLYATSSVELPTWVGDMAKESRWMTQRSSCIGYVAVCDDPREIQRMGRRDIVIALRGTATLVEWAENFRPHLVQIPELELESGAGGNAKVECGFLSLYKTRGPNGQSLAESVVQEVQRLVELYKGETLSITVTGHSLGAALSLLVADELSSSLAQAPRIAVFSFGGPRVGNRGFADRVNAKQVKVLRIVNNQDVITKVPGILVNDQAGCESGRDWSTTRIGSLITEAIDRNNPMAYSHVGSELRVDTRMSPYLKPNADVACCHDLEAYLHLVDGFMGSNCPFRANAKRSLWKLVTEQKNNVKLYGSKKYKGLNLDVILRKEGLGSAIPSCLPSPS